MIVYATCKGTLRWQYTMGIKARVEQINKKFGLVGNLKVTENELRDLYRGHNITFSKITYRVGPTTLDDPYT